MAAKLFLGVLLGLSVSPWICVAAQDGPPIKLKAQIRESAVPDRGQSISLAAVRPFLKRSLIFDQRQQLQNMPYVFSDERARALLLPNSTIYVRGAVDPDESSYDVLNKQYRTYVHPRTKETLGYEAFVIGSATLEQEGDPATFRLTQVQEPVFVGSRVVPSFASVLPLSLNLKPSTIKTPGYILSARGIENNSGVGAGSVVTLSVGAREGVEAGHTLDIYRAGKTMADPMGKKGWRAEKVQLPDRRLGRLLVFQVYEKLSLGLILESAEPLNILDVVKASTRKSDHNRRQMP